VTLRSLPGRTLAALLLAFAIHAASPSPLLCQTANSAVPVAQPLTLPQYIQELDRCAEVLNGTPVDAKAASELRASLQAKWEVMDGGAHYSVDTSWLSGALANAGGHSAGADEALGQARERLELYRREAKALADEARAQRNHDQARAQLDSILNAREFRGGQGPSWLDIERQKLRDWIYRQLEKLFGRARVRSIGNIVAWSLVGLASVLLIFWTLRFLMRDARRTDMDLSGAAPIGRDWRRWLRQAREAAARGEYRSAIHAAYWTAIVRMEETKSLPEDRSRTPRESLRLVGRSSPVYAPLSQLTRRFELVWYGYRDATAADWNDAARQLEMLGCPLS